MTTEVRYETRVGGSGGPRKVSLTLLRRVLQIPAVALGYVALAWFGMLGDGGSADPRTADGVRR